MALIEFENVDLIYPVRENRGITLRDLILKGLFRRQGRPRWKEVHALKDITFLVHDGERIGIIGHNGAGKSTLLRAIGGIYPIRSGIRRVTGELCSLFDIAIGFEPAATGWDNIRFRGYLQGETPKTLGRKIHEIAAFTELGDFLNLPLHCYSAGMIMRLAFAIATSGNPEILLVDEVFAVGDLHFQHKAEQRIKEFMGRARAVVMVGHALDFLQAFCTRVLWLEQGRLRADGAPAAIIAQYRSEMESKTTTAAAAAA
jgi:ABC-type polysaccharide/polyol phosphate transport system ATPase subunit